LVLWGGLVGAMTGTVIAGARVNSTASFPVGLYWAIDVPPNKGDLVLFCPPRGEVFDEAKRRGYLGAGYCPGGYGYLLKKIVAVHNDIVTVTDEGVFVNSERIQNSQPLQVDLAGQNLPHFRTLAQRMKQDDVVLLSDYSQKSFDARYFGPLNKNQIQNVVRPVLTW
jgi:conjugative transfer signal peptidase TraF